MLAMFWTGTLYYPVFSSLSFSFFFLSLDRLFTLTYPLRYTNKHRRLLTYLNVTTQVCVYVITVTFEILLLDQVRPGYDLLGLSYYRIYVKYSAARVVHGSKKVNHAALFAVSLELFFKLLPQALIRIHAAMGGIMHTKMGPFLTYFHAAEVTCLTLAYCSVLGVKKRLKQPSSSVISRVQTRTQPV
ncbi:unnamed protein product [Bursaphelenchus okinawaensis]|uniref:Uncharacterized protein n=1 Tax=Bursaphelenchus okinawaensis TaxID=465554 RepID=A0A811L1E4_9BILA|nr:unnamed protein product [Bursaphelenchus okinawaensis]CAG9115170.1 unnamed protein product [Bursaphelenchus okinawaensis]